MRYANYYLRILRRPKRIVIGFSLTRSNERLENKNIKITLKCIFSYFLSYFANHIDKILHRFVKATTTMKGGEIRERGEKRLLEM